MVIRRMAIKAFGKSVGVGQIDFDSEGKMVMKTSEVAVSEDTRKLEDVANPYLNLGGMLNNGTILSEIYKAEASVWPLFVCHYIP